MMCIGVAYNCCVDPQDPAASLYDVDDETTVITLAVGIYPMHLLPYLKRICRIVTTILRRTLQPFRRQVQR